VEQLSSREVYRNAWMRVREDDVRRDDGSTGVYGVVDKPDFVLVLPRHDTGFWMVEQFRYPIGRRAWEFPQGGWGAGAGGSQEELARAELAEETGLHAESIGHLGRLATAYGFCSQYFDVYLATGLVDGGAPNREASEQDMVHRAFTDAEVSDLVISGRMVDAHSLAALSLFRLHTTGPSGLVR